LQQRYSAYSQRPGLTRVPKAALGLLPDSQIGEEEKPTHAASVEDTGRVTTGVAPGRFVGFVECLKRLFKN
jgi:hypothetical protein